MIFITDFREVIYKFYVTSRKVDLQEVGWRGMDWIDLAEDRGRWWALVNAVMNLRVS
jgi:hypothetical protein